ncbi:AfaD family invasin [Providencia sp. SP181]|uniref:AfaD family invasin n=1 Tax=Providencia sp. SP181 TaxID=3136277 RepID=UPI003D2A29A8
MKIKRRTVFITMVVMLGALGIAIQAVASPQLTLQVREGLQAGTVSDGTVLAYGKVRDTDLSGAVEFHVWSDAAVQDAPAIYTLTSPNNTGYRLRVRLVGEGWQADEMQGRGIIRLSEASHVTFRVEVDGDQTVPSARWHLGLQAVTRTPVSALALDDK